MASDYSPSTAFGQVHAQLRCAADYEWLARNILDENIWAHLTGGSAHDKTVKANLRAFDDYAIVPRLLRAISSGHTTFMLTGTEYPHPIMLAPVGSQALYHPHGEIGTAQAAGATESCMIASTMSSVTLEEIAAAAGPMRWFQLYFQPSRGATVDLIKRAETAGYQVIVITLDAPVQMPSFAAQEAGSTPASHPSANLQHYTPVTPPTATGKSRVLNTLMQLAPTWDDLDWIMEQTSLPIWIKGVLHPDDARAFQDKGAAGVIISNHGGRSLDGVIPSLDAIAPIRAALGEDFPIIFDGGIRSGTDIFKAIALGADAILIGRLQIYALAAAGALGVGHMIKLLREELEYCMALSGCATLADVRRATLIQTRNNQGAENADHRP